MSEHDDVTRAVRTGIVLAVCDLIRAGVRVGRALDGMEARNDPPEVIFRQVDEAAVALMREHGAPL
jgi:hypothetical protein